MLTSNLINNTELPITQTRIFCKSDSLICFNSRTNPKSSDQSYKTLYPSIT